MAKLLNWLRKRLQRFLGISNLPDFEAQGYYAALAHKLVTTHTVYGDKDRFIVGQNVVLNNALINTVSGFVTLQDSAFCGHGVSLLTGTHDYRCEGMKRQLSVPQAGQDILIESGVWIGSNATVLGPCVIGHHAVIAAGAVVTGDVEAWCIYAGMPACKIASIDRPT